jgi:hypothetical protein
MSVNRGVNLWPKNPALAGNSRLRWRARKVVMGTTSMYVCMYVCIF